MMDTTTLVSLLLTGAGTGLSCGVSCGACGNPMVNVFLAGYLFTHTDRLKKSLLAFAGYHIGKAMTVSALCVLVSCLGSQIVDEQGRIFGIDLHQIVYWLMLCFVFVLIVRWFWTGRHPQKGCCDGTCHTQRERSTRFWPMLLYGAVSGMSPCASLLVVLSYASAVRIGEAVLVGLGFSLANSLVPLLLLTALTGLLTEQMHREIPEKIRYFQLATLIIFALALIKNL